MKCNSCGGKAIIKFRYPFISDKNMCMDCLVDFLDEIIKDKERHHLITNIKKIIPIYNE